MPNPFLYERRVEFCETDAAGIAHFSSFICYMEQAEHAFWRSLGTSVVQDMDDGAHLSWPRVRVECDYTGSARFEDVLTLALTLTKLGRKSVSYQFRFLRQQQQIAEGLMVAVCCRVEKNKPLVAVDIPESTRHLLEPYLAGTAGGA